MLLQVALFCSSYGWLAFCCINSPRLHASYGWLAFCCINSPRLHASDDERWLCFCLVAAVNSAAVNIGVRGSLRVILSRYTPQEWACRIVWKFCVSVLGSLRPGLHSGCTSVHSPAVSDGSLLPALGQSSSWPCARLSAERGSSFSQVCLTCVLSTHVFPVTFSYVFWKSFAAVVND